MKVKEALRGIRRYFEAFEAALDYDPYTDIRLRIERLERDSRSQAERLAALSQEVQALRTAS